MSFFQKIKNFVSNTTSTVTKSTSILAKKFASIFKSPSFSEDSIEELEKLLIDADVGFIACEQICDFIKKTKKKYSNEMQKEEESIVLKKELEEFLIAKLKKLESKLELKEDELNILIMCGVNGAGKTTTIKKLINKYDNLNILVACCDMFRAAAYEQLKIAVSDTKANFLELTGKNTPDSVVYKAIDATKTIYQNTNLLFLDTSGRLHNNQNLMEEFAKLTKVIKKASPNSNQKTILVLDGTTGQNIINQVEIFSKITNISGLILTKFDGIAKGGILLQLADKFDIPVYFLGIGEQKNDLITFDAKTFVENFLNE
ncbi:MAG: signal recognition particle-docking protein FtsY [Rickettsiales bacterium]